AHPATRRAADRDRDLLARAPVRLGGDGDDRVEGAGDEVGELKLPAGALAHPGGAERCADESLLGDRRVHHAVGAELLVQAGRDAESPPETAHVPHKPDTAVRPRATIS